MGCGRTPFAPQWRVPSGRARSLAGVVTVGIDYHCYLQKGVMMCQLKKIRGADAILITTLVNR